MIINIKAYKINKIFNAINVRTSMMHQDNKIINKLYVIIQEDTKKIFTIRKHQISSFLMIK